MDFALSIVEQGLIYGILALGVYITYKILDFPDMIHVFCSHFLMNYK